VDQGIDHDHFCQRSAGPWPITNEVFATLLLIAAGGIMLSEPVVSPLLWSWEQILRKIA
jgi:hypothetical protein